MVTCRVGGKGGDRLGKGYGGRSASIGKALVLKLGGGSRVFFFITLHTHCIYFKIYHIFS